MSMAEDSHELVCLNGWVGVDGLFLRSEQLASGPCLKQSKYTMYGKTEVEGACLAEVECRRLEARSGNQATAALRDGFVQIENCPLMLCLD
jgi:hypothetical protein